MKNGVTKMSGARRGKRVAIEYLSSHKQKQMPSFQVLQNKLKILKNVPFCYSCMRKKRSLSMLVPS